MKNRLGWHVILVLAVITGLLLLLAVDDLPVQEKGALANLFVLVCFGAAGLAIYRVLYGDRPWQRPVQAWVERPVTHWNDWRNIGLLASIAFGLHFLSIVDLPPDDKWTSASVLLLLALCLAGQMIGVAFFRKRDRK
jgi:hypothetical protein